jgi:hypothetical protein
MQIFFLCCQREGDRDGALLKRKENIPHISGNSDGIGCKVIYEEMHKYSI